MVCPDPIIPLPLLIYGFVYIWYFGANVVPFTSKVVSLILVAGLDVI